MVSVDCRDVGLHLLAPGPVQFRGDVAGRTGRDRSVRAVRVGRRPTVRSGNPGPSAGAQGRAHDGGERTAARRLATVPGGPAGRLIGGRPWDIGRDAAGRHVRHRRGHGPAPRV